MKLEDVEVGMKVKVVSLKNTCVGGLPVKIGDTVEVYGIRTKCCGDNNTLQLFDEWSISHLDVEPADDKVNKGLSKQEYESLKSGDKLKIVSLEHTRIGDANLEIGEVVVFVDYHLNSLSDNDLFVKKEDGFSWFISSKDLEVVNNTEYKVGDEVIFTKYENDREWEKVHGGFVGEKYVIDYISTGSSLSLINSAGACFYVDSTQIEPCNRIDKVSKEDDLVNSPKHYATDPSGVECVQIKRKMSANAGDAFKYTWRVGKKWDDKQDLEKALWYINDAIEHDVPVWLHDGVDLETEALIHQVLKHREGWQYMFINAVYWSNLEEAKRAVEIGIKQFGEVVSG